ncbi:organic cation transporter protein-like [Schistocerca nitens]|uniref:organic cation transporter protein-like n=1 Tax=Schistocerca nitens TaxID=7011 RepID=UPI0021189A43|nr:organic cation transporter protein-like [Schistocerca nitens]XP_049807426.1 organic cation transporter protein-like [Schistocerca nitens]XP_049807427.1 organic cation transporter protein-like [Schistocerca nitens]
MAYELDEVLEELGRFGKYQAFTFIYITVPIIFHVITGLSFIFTAGTVEHRCHVPGCEADWSSGGLELEPRWLRYAVPHETRAGALRPARCLAYARANDTDTDTDTAAPDGECPASLFSNDTLRCEHWVFENPRATIAGEWDITCDENQWKLTLVGTVNSVGYFVTTPIAGYASDRFGRKTVLLYAVGLSALVGIARSFSPNYIVFIIMEFVDMVCGGSVYETAYVLGMEQVGPSARVLASAIMGAVDVIGEILLGFLAWLLQDWRMLLRIAYLPGFIMVSCYWWILPESVRWLMVNGRASDANVIIQKAAKQNGVDLSEKAIKRMQLAQKTAPVHDDIHGSDSTDDSCKTGKLDAIVQVMHSSTLMVRLFVCCFCWGTNMFVFYGLSLYSVAMAGNKYLNFMLVSLIELPGCLAAYYALERMGRRVTLSTSFLLAAVACLAFTVVPPDMQTVRILLYLVGKFGITISYSAIHVYATELFPTQIRHLMIGTCTMVGGAGEMAAPQAPLLVAYAEWLPVAVFGAMALASGLLALIFPETKNTRLPDTIHEAEDIGRSEPNTVV